MQEDAGVATKPSKMGPIMSQITEAFPEVNSMADKFVSILDKTMTIATDTRLSHRSITCTDSIWTWSNFEAFL